MTVQSRGRPRSEQAHKAVLQATCELIGEIGVERLTIEGIAARARVGKHTVYRWWPSKSAVVAEAIHEGYLRFDEQPLRDTGDLRRDLLDWLQNALTLFSLRENAELLRALAAAAGDARDGEIEQLYGRMVAPVHDELVERLHSAVAAGQLRPEVKPDVIVHLLLGCIVFQVLASPVADSERAAQMIDVLLAGVLPPGSTSGVGAGAAQG